MRQAETADGERHSLLLQNAETVRLVGPAAPSHIDFPRATAPASAGRAHGDGIADEPQAGDVGTETSGEGGEGRSRRAMADDGAAEGGAAEERIAGRTPTAAAGAEHDSAARSHAEAVPIWDAGEVFLAAGGAGAVDPRAGMPVNEGRGGGSGEAGAWARAEPGKRSDADHVDWRAVAVSELREGDAIFLLRQAGARHTGVAIQEFVLEK